jgi:hypothetical protein
VSKQSFDVSLFSVQPGIDADGQLTYTPADHAVGLAVVTVQLHVDGAAINGGSDTSAPQTITIGINNLFLMSFNITKMVVDFSRQDDRDSINMKAQFTLPHGISFDPKIDAVSFHVDGVSINISAGSFKGNKKI